MTSVLSYPWIGMRKMWEAVPVLAYCSLANILNKSHGPPKGHVYMKKIKLLLAYSEWHLRVGSLTVSEGKPLTSLPPAGPGAHHLPSFVEILGRHVRDWQVLSSVPGALWSICVMSVKSFFLLIWAVASFLLPNVRIDLFDIFFILYLRLHFSSSFPWEGKNNSIVPSFYALGQFHCVVLWSWA